VSFIQSEYFFSFTSFRHHIPRSEAEHSVGPSMFSQPFPRLFVLLIYVPLQLCADHLLAFVAHVPSISNGNSQFRGSYCLSQVAVQLFLLVTPRKSRFCRLITSFHYFARSPAFAAIQYTQK
jgi:hypothetical protein